jgi:hypothetical protein
MTTGRIPGLTAPRSKIPRRRARMRTLWILGPVAVAVLLLLTADGGTVFTAGTVSDDDLISQLAEVEEELTGVPLMPAVSVSPDGAWGTVRGDFVGTRLRLERSSGALGELVEAGSRANTPVGDAVAEVAAAYRRMLEGYVRLEAYEEATLAIFYGPGDGDPGIGVEEARGHAEVGLRLLLQSLESFRSGYAYLRDADAAAGTRALFELRFSDVEQAAQGDAYRANRVLSEGSTEVLVPVSRFEPSAGGGNPAQTVTYVCADRSGYLAARPAEAEPPDLPEPGGAGLGIPDCPDLANEHTVTSGGGS